MKAKYIKPEAIVAATIGTQTIMAASESLKVSDETTDVYYSKEHTFTADDIDLWD